MDIDFRVSVVLPASGTGERFGKYPPKQFTSILGQTVILHTISNFHRLAWVDEIAVVVSKVFLESTNQLVSQNNLYKVKVVEGCLTRHRSIYAGIKAIKKDNKNGVVIIQDGVRLFADEELIKQIAMAAKKYGAAGVTRSLVSTVISADSDNFLKESLNRSQYRASEMPQGFMYNVINTAYEKATDDDFDHGTECLLLAMKYADTKARLIDGPDNLWKVTYRKDIYAAEVLLKESYLRVRMLPDKCETNYTDVCNKIRALCKERRMVIESDQDEKFTSKCNSYVFLTDKLSKDTLYDTTDQIHSCVTNGTEIQIPPCIIHVFTNTSIDMCKLTCVYSYICRTYEKGIHHGIVFESGADSNKLAEMVVDLIWNRTKSLSGQILTIR